MNAYDYRHPDYISLESEWLKWRLAYEGGRPFIDNYLQKFSSREDETDFNDRKLMTYNPKFAGSAIDDVKNSIYQRMGDIVRKDGPNSYQKAILGREGGVDFRNKDINTFIGCDVLTELLVMGKVGVFVDRPPKKGDTLYDNIGDRPYLYLYKAEDILCWVEDPTNPFAYKSILLRDHAYEIDENTGFPTGCSENYRHIWVDEKGVNFILYNEKGEALSERQVLNIKTIPFVCFKLSESLMKDIADYQIALLNLASSDINYCIKSNFPFYVEPYDPASENSQHLRVLNEGGDATEAASQTASNKEIRVGVSQGRRYPNNVQPPQFIHPSSEPIKASMEKQEQIKRDIRHLLNLSINSLRPVRESADSKKEDDRGLENGLSYIGLTLEGGERQIVKIWSEYEAHKKEVTIKYPRNYELVSDYTRYEQAEKVSSLIHKLPSLTYQKLLGKEISRILLSSKVSNDELEKIDSEIDKATNMNTDPDVVIMDVENGLVSRELASKMRMYPPEEVGKANVEHAERLKRILESQGGEGGSARGVKDLEGVDSRKEKAASRINDTKDSVADRTRGDGK